MRGFEFGEIKWTANGVGIQKVKLPPQVTRDRHGRALPGIKQSHYKLWWGRADGGRDFICRQPTRRAALAFAKTYLPLLP